MNRLHMARENARNIGLYCFFLTILNSLCISCLGYSRFIIEGMLLVPTVCESSLGCQLFTPNRLQTKKYLPLFIRTDPAILPSLKRTIMGATRI